MPINSEVVKAPPYIETNIKLLIKRITRRYHTLQVTTSQLRNDSSEFYFFPRTVAWKGVLLVDAWICETGEFVEALFLPFLKQITTINNIFSSFQCANIYKSILFKASRICYYGSVYNKPLLPWSAKLQSEPVNQLGIVSHRCWNRGPLKTHKCFHRAVPCLKIFKWEVIDKNFQDFPFLNWTFDIRRWLDQWTFRSVHQCFTYRSRSLRYLWTDHATDVIVSYNMM